MRVLSETIDKTWLKLWSGAERGQTTLINLSENHIYRVDVDGAPRFILRLHRPGYQSLPTIESELSWIDALGRDTDLPVPEPLVGIDGRRVQMVDDRCGVLFAYKPGREAAPDDDNIELFRVLGRYAATAHRHVQTYTLPEAFTRPHWNVEAILDADGLWGDWRAAPRVTGDIRTVLNDIDAALRADIAAYGKHADRYGLIHADMRLANVLIDGPRVRIIDFDDSGFGWFMYDFAAAISFYEDAPDVPDLRRAWLQGYAEVRALSAADLNAIDAMVLLRRMALLAWIGSHAETDLAKSFEDDFARVTAELGRAYLSNR